MNAELRAWLETPFAGYAYSYPHKTAYRELDARPLAEVWRGEPRDSLFLYMHIPFCEMRCGFCNLFTEARPKQRSERTTAFLDALERQAEVVREELGELGFARMAIGGGTPTYLEPDQLRRVFGLARMLGAEAGIPTSVESSPETASADRLQVLADNQVTRVSIGVQSFLDDEVRRLGRAQKRAVVEGALDRIRAHPFELNIDLIYGVQDQTRQTLDTSIDAALTWKPEEIFLYPLYVRPLTGLGRSKKSVRGRSPDGPEPASKPLDPWDEHRLSLYLHGRERLLQAGYVQRSMRCFRRADASQGNLPPYRCQEDGMIGLGPGARSYTRDLHYSFDYAVTGPAVREIITQYIEQTDFRYVRYGAVVGDEDQRRRFVIQSLLWYEGLNLERYRARFGTHAIDDLAELRALTDTPWIQFDESHVQLLPEGFAYSDALGPWLYAPQVRRRMQEFELR